MNGGHNKVALPEGTEVGGYRILRVLGDGGFGVTYMAEDFRGQQFAVKEYLPNQLAVRDGKEVHPKSDGSREDFEWGRERFVEEARMLARFKHPNIVQVEHFFKENNTAYIVMAYEEGESLDEVLRRLGTLTEEQLTRILLPIVDGLREVHGQGVWHRDIKPGNIFVRRSDESPVLLDFGAARSALGEKSESVEAIISPPYSPPEQYYSEGELGPYTDIYALSALCYRAITGELPAESPLRERRRARKGDPLPPLVEMQPEGCSDALLAAVDWGLALDEAKRPQSVDEWLAAIEKREPADIDPDEDAAEETPRLSVFRRVLRGQLGLAQTYWLFGVFGGFLFGILHGVAAEIGGSEVAALGVLLVYLAYHIWVTVGVWRAGRAYRGSAIWPFLARFSLIVGLAATILSLVLRVPDVLFEIDQWRSTPAPPPPAVPSFTIENLSAHDVVVVQATPRTMPWGDSKLGTATIPAGRRHTISLVEYEYGDACEFNVRVETADTQTHEWRPADLCRDNEVVIPGSEPSSDDEASDSVADSESAGPPPVAPPAPPPKPRITESDEPFRDCPTCPEMVVVPAGSYRMGSPPEETGRDPREGPVHEVTFSTPFAIGVYEVTVAEFGTFVDETGYSAGTTCHTSEQGEYQERVGRGWRNPGIAQDGGHPVACVSWDDARAFVAWLSRETGEAYRLPSEAEWEYAARAGTTAARYWGETAAEQCRYANGADRSLRDYWDDDEPTALCRDGHAKTAPVGSFAPNAWGLHDMLGNVHEWTSDCWNSNYMGAPTEGSTRQHGDCTRRVLRGGSWDSEPSQLRVADRRWPSLGAASRYDYFGLRVARTVDPGPLGPAHPLTVRTGPPDALVQIMNIVPPYERGMRLPRGSYTVKVSAQDFDTVERTLQHGAGPTDVWIGLPFRDCPICPKMVEIPAGSYKMGTSSGAERESHEGPVHEVSIAYPLAVGVFEVSFEEWDACLADRGCRRHLSDEGRGRGQHPAVHATLNDAKEYAKWLEERTGRRYRLPSEAEWEYAARAGTLTVRHWDRKEDQCAFENGADITAQQEHSHWTVVNCADGYIYAAPGNGTRFKPNPWGLYHMLGNVSEWTEDCYHPNYKGAPRDGSSWMLGCDSEHVARGGSWSSKPRGMRAPTRLRYDVATEHDDLGFRVVVEINR